MSRGFLNPYSLFGSMAEILGIGANILCKSGQGLTISTAGLVSELISNGSDKFLGSLDS